MKFLLVLAIAAVSAVSALAQDMRNPGGDFGPPGAAPTGFPPPGARPLDPPGSGPVGSGAQVIGSPMSPDNYYVPSPSPLPYANRPTAPATAIDGGWMAGAGVMILQPHFSNNPAYDRLGANSTDTQTLQPNQQTDFNMGAAAAPLVWLGYMGENGLGIRARWWRFYDKDTLSFNSPAQTGSTTTTTYSAYPAGVGFSAVSSTSYNDAFTFASDLTMNVTDLEILWDLHPARGSLVFGAGVRYAHLSQNYNSSWVSTPLDSTQDTYTTTLTSGHNFSGAGPVASVETGYPLGMSGFRLLGTARGSLLFGTGIQQANMLALDTDAGGNVVSQTLTSNSESVGGTMPVLEFELGADWGHVLGAYRLAIQAAMVGQLWFYGGNASNNNSVFGSSFPQQNQSTQETIGIIGARIAASMSY